MLVILTRRPNWWPWLHRQRGIALILVLWLLAALSLIMVSVVSTMGLESRQSQAELQRSKALIAAEGGLVLVVYKLLQDPDRFPANGQVLRVDLNGLSLSLSVRSEHGKLDLNFAHLDHFANLLSAMGASPKMVEILSMQLRSRRDQGEPLKQLEELLAVTAISTTLYQRILPYVTLWGGDVKPVSAYADPILRDAIGLPKVELLPSNPGSILGIDVQATLPDGFSAGLSTTVLLTPEDNEAGVFRILRWEER